MTGGRVKHHVVYALVLVLWLLCAEPRGPVKIRGRL